MSDYDDMSYSEEQYDDFLEWAEEKGLNFPCTASQFYARASQFADGDNDILVALCDHGIGQGHGIDLRADVIQR